MRNVRTSKKKPVHTIIDNFDFIARDLAAKVARGG